MDWKDFTDIEQVIDEAKCLLLLEEGWYGGEESLPADLQSFNMACEFARLYPDYKPYFTILIDGNTVLDYQGLVMIFGNECRYCSEQTGAGKFEYKNIPTDIRLPSKSQF